VTLLLPDADEHAAIRAAARAAEDAGNLRGALRLVPLLPDEPERRRWVQSLEEGLHVETEKDETARTAWLLQPAMRHAAGSVAWSRLLTLAADVLRTRGIPTVAGDLHSVAAATGDPPLIDAGLFDLGMLQSYLDAVLLPRGREAAGTLATWTACPVSAHEVLGVDRDTATVRDLVGGTEVPLKGSGWRAGALLYGRVVSEAGVARFALPPVELDRIAARRVARAVVRRAPVGERLRAVASYQRRSA
jgi:hypothetical protein